MNFSFASDHLKDETKAVNDLLGSLNWDKARAKRVEGLTALLIEKIKAQKTSPTDIEHFLSHYPLGSEEGLALMTLAEALLRIPDTETQDALIEEKILNTDWSAKSGDNFMKAAGIGLNLAQKTLGSFLGAVGRPVIRKSIGEAVKRIGAQFVLAETIDGAVSKAKDFEARGYRLSYDMLGEGARTDEDAERYFRSYEAAAKIIGAAGSGASGTRSGMSVKLSALHPRYTWTQNDKCVPAITEKLLKLCRIAAQYNMGLTVDAEEADRLELSLQIIENICTDDFLKNWDGFGLAIQAYDKRCFCLVDDIYNLARTHNRKLQIRLVKGAYWDSEIKRSQMAGLKEYPLYTRKSNTDLSYLACAEKLLKYRDYIYPMFATHNAQTVAGIFELAGDNRQGFEFQKLYGMGNALGDVMTQDRMAPVCIYAPVGSYEDLLPYLVRRMLENGANTSFISQMREADTSNLSGDKILPLKDRDHHAHKAIPLPRYIYSDRINSEGVDYSVIQNREALKTSRPIGGAASIIDGVSAARINAAIRIPLPASTAEQGSETWEIAPQQIESVFTASRKGFAQWSIMPAKKRGDILRRIADLLEKHRDELMALLRSEGGRTLADSLSEIREAADFCRYYAVHGETLFEENGVTLEGPTGESNILHLTPRGIFVCISPWNFPAAIFTGQIVAALMAGNAVIAKPAEQTPMIAHRIVRLMHEAGVPAAALNLVLGDGKVGAVLVNHKDTAGVVFTGSTEVAKSINRSLAAKDGPIVPLIAETGGQNAMIVDSSALLEQVVDDVVISAFGSAGQRCSALRVLYIQDDVANRFCHLLRGAMEEIRLGDPREYSTDVGPVIDGDALKKLEEHKTYLHSFGKKICETPKPVHLQGYYFAPVAYEIDSLSQLKGEVFGPVLHVIRYKTKNRDKIVNDLNTTGYGLTFGLHSRLSDSFGKTAEAVHAGNIYINRTVIGAVVGVQPFGGMGLSGTGPKAGGPHYLSRFAHEKTITINTTATGGNIGLISLEDM